MGIEYAGLNGNRPVTEAMNLTQRLQNFMTTNLSIEMNISSVDALLREVEENLKRGASSSRSSWKTDVSINTYRKWVYFIIMTMTTVGKGHFTLSALNENFKGTLYFTHDGSFCLIS